MCICIRFKTSSGSQRGGPSDKGGGREEDVDFVFCFVFVKEVGQLTRKRAREEISRRWLGWCWVTLAIAGCCVLGQLYRRVSDMWGCRYLVMITGWTRYQLKNKRHSDFSWRWAIWKNYCQQEARSNHDNGLFWWDHGQIYKRRGPDPPLVPTVIWAKNNLCSFDVISLAPATPSILSSSSNHICYLNPCFVFVGVKF